MNHARSVAVGRIRYPLRARVGVSLAALFVLAELGMLALFMMPLVPLVPLVPVFIMIMLGNAFVLAEVVQWAASLGQAETLESGRAAETRRGATERQAHAEAA